MLRVPEEHGGEQEKRDHAAGIGPGRDKPFAALCGRDQPEENAGAEEETRIFRKKTKTARDAHRKPPAPVLPFDELRECKQQKRRCDKRRRVGRRGHGFRRDHERQVEIEARKRCRSHAAQQDFAGPPDGPARDDRQKKRHQAHADRRVAEDQRAGADDIGDGGRMIVIARRQMLRPQPVIGFVERQRQEDAQCETQKRQDGNGDDNSAVSQRSARGDGHLPCPARKSQKGPAPRNEAPVKAMGRRSRHSAMRTAALSSETLPEGNRPDHRRPRLEKGENASG
jgi:hypothetical protein